MKKLIALAIAACLLIPAQAHAATNKPTPKPTVTKSKAVKKPVVKKKVVKKKKKLPAKKALKWPPPGFDKKDSLYAKTATPKELGIAGTENKYIQKNLIDYCHKVACLGIFVGSETGCDWWEITSNVLGIDPSDPTQRIIYGSLTTLVAGSKAKTIKTILLISDEPIADGLGIGAYTANCRIGSPTGKIPSNTYTKSPTRS
ncbi:hypothetical protein MCEMZLE12_00489 [actinobacterium SCGC AAA044-D11]